MNSKYNAFAISALLPVLLTIGFSAFVTISETSCASSEQYTYTNSSGASVTITGFGAWCENHLALIRSSTKTFAVTGASVAGKSNPRATAAVISDIKAVNVPLVAVLNNQAATLDDIDSALLKASVSDPTGIFATFIQPGLTMAAGYVVQLKNEGTPVKVGIDILGAVVNGLNDAVQQLSPAASLRLPCGFTPITTLGLLTEAFN